MTTGNNDDLVGSIGGFPPHSNFALLDPDYRYLNASIVLLLKIYPVLVLVFGSFGNLLSFCVLLRAAMRRYSTFCYLACLALVDIGVIITFCVNFIALYHFNYDIQNVACLCKLFAFSIYFLPQYSSWILVAVSIDRVISAKYLRLAKTWSKPRHSVLVTFVLGLFLAVLNSHFFLYENNSIKQRNASQPHPTSRHQSNVSAVDRYLLATAFAHHNGPFPAINTYSDAQIPGNSGGASRSESSVSYEPFTPPSSQFVSRETTLQVQLDNLIGIKQEETPIFDVNMIHCSLENSLDHKRLYVYWAWIDLAMNVFIPFTGKRRTTLCPSRTFVVVLSAMIACTIVIILTLVRSSSRAGSTSARRSRRRRNISVMLITVNLVFISLTAPIVIFLSISEHFKDDNNSHRQTVLILIKIICIILMNLNHSVNIVIYSVTAKEFRSEMVNFLHAVIHCIIGRPVNTADLDYLQDDGTFVSRLRRLRRNFFKCCPIKLRSNSTNTTDSSGLHHHHHHHRTGAPTANHSRSGNHQTKMKKRKRQNGNGKRKCSLPRTSETSTLGGNHRLTVQVQNEPSSSTYEREDISFHGLSISTEDWLFKRNPVSLYSILPCVYGICVFFRYSSVIVLCYYSDFSLLSIRFPTPIFPPDPFSFLSSPRTLLNPFFMNTNERTNSSGNEKKEIQKNNWFYRSCSSPNRDWPNRKQLVQYWKRDRICSEHAMSFDSQPYEEILLRKQNRLIQASFN